MSIGKYWNIGVLIILLSLMGFTTIPTDISTNGLISINTPRNQTYYDWIGDLPRFSFNYANNSYVDTPIFNLTWNYYTNNTIGYGFLMDFDIYINNSTNMIMETFRNLVPYPHNEIQIYGEVYKIHDYYFKITQYPRSIEINLTRFNIPFGSTLLFNFTLQTNLTTIITSILTINYDTEEPVVIIEIPEISYTYMIIGGVMVGGFIGIYFFYQSRLKKKDETVRYEYEE